MITKDYKIHKLNGTDLKHKVVDTFLSCTNSTLHKSEHYNVFTIVTSENEYIFTSETELLKYMVYSICDCIDI